MLWDSEDVQAVRLACKQQLEAVGVPVPREELDLLSTNENEELNSSFGVSLFNAPTFPYQWRDCTLQLPKIFVVLVEFLEGHVCDEGLFRKAGSISRQRSLRAALTHPTPALPCDCNVHDVASIFKQFLRELPHPLLPANYWPLLEACASLASENEQSKYLHLATLLLPSPHLQCLCVVMELLHKVSCGVGNSLMDASNLAVVMAPNLLRTSKDIRDLHDNTLRVQQRIVKLLIEGADGLGVIPQQVCEVASEIERGQVCDDPLPDDLAVTGKERKLLPSSITGLLTGWGNKILRRRGVAGDGRGVASDEESVQRWSLKRTQQDTLDRPVKRRRGLESSVAQSYGAVLAPLKRRRGLGRKLKQACMDGDGVDGESHTPDVSPDVSHTPNDSPDNSPDIGHALNRSLVVPPTPLLLRGLHAVKLRHSKTMSSLNVASSKATPSLGLDFRKATPPVLHSLAETSPSSPTHLSSTPVEKYVEQVSFSSPTPSVVDTDISNSVAWGRGRSCDLLRTPGVFSAVHATQSPNLMDKICSEMALRSHNRHTRKGHVTSGSTQEISQESHVISQEGHVISQEGHVTSGSGRVTCEGVPARRRRGRGPHGTHSSAALGYSASLGINLPRRQLRQEEPHPLVEDQRDTPSSPVVLSASLGITQLGRNRPRRRARGHRVNTQRRQLNETASFVATPPPILKILEENTQPRETAQQKMDATGTNDRPGGQTALGPLNPPTNTNRPGGQTPLGPLNPPTNTNRPGGQTPLGPLNPPTNNTNRPGGQTPLGPLNPPTNTNRPGGQMPLCPLNPPTNNTNRPGGQTPLCPLNPPTPAVPCTLPVEIQPHPPYQRYRSPWRWGTTPHCTPFKPKGKLTKRARPYSYVDMPRPSLHKAAKENHPHLQDSIDVEEWVL